MALTVEGTVVVSEEAKLAKQMGITDEGGATQELKCKYVTASMAEQIATVCLKNTLNLLRLQGNDLSGATVKGMHGVAELDWGRDGDAGQYGDGGGVTTLPRGSRHTHRWRRMDAVALRRPT